MYKNFLALVLLITSISSVSVKAMFNRGIKQNRTEELSVEAEAKYEDEEDSNNNVGKAGYIGAALVVNTIAYCANFSPRAALNPLITQVYGAPWVGSASQALGGVLSKTAGAYGIRHVLGFTGQAMSYANHYAVPILLGAAVIKCGLDSVKLYKLNKDPYAGIFLPWGCFKRAISDNSALVTQAFIKHKIPLTFVCLYLGMAAFSNKN